MIRYLAIITAILVLALTPVIAQTLVRGNYKLSDGSDLSIRASAIAGLGSTKLVMKENAYVKRVSKATNTEFEAEGAKMTVALFEKKDAKGDASGFSGIKSVDIAGPVKLVYITFDPASGNKTITTITGNSANYNGTTQLAQIIGNVKLVSNNPAVFENPGVLTGETATINLKPKLGEDEFRFEIEGSPSRIELTPKEKVNDKN